MVTWAYTANNNHPSAAALDNNILHGPGPVPVYLNGCVAVYKDQVACSELLIPEICTFKQG